MTISIIAAVAKNRVIGMNNSLPWHLPADMRHFRALTMGKPIIMGKKTFESLGKPLPQRLNIVLSDERDYQPAGCVVVHSLEEAIAVAGKSKEVMIGGGASVYKQFMEKADRLYLTVIHQEFEGDAYFPEVDPAHWREVRRVDGKADEKNPYDYSFVVFERTTSVRS